MGLVRQGRLVDIDTSTPAKLRFTTALSARGKLALLRGFLRLRGSINGVDSYELVQSAPMDDPDISAYEFGMRSFGREVTEYLIDPMMRLTTGKGARDASSLNVLGALGAWSGPLRNVRGGLAAVTGELASRVPVLCGATVTAVAETESGVVVSYNDGAGQHEIAADGCVLAAMYHRTAEIWPTLCTASPAFGDKLRNVKRGTALQRKPGRTQCWCPLARSPKRC